MMAFGLTCLAAGFGKCKKRLLRFKQVYAETGTHIFSVALFRLPFIVILIAFVVLIVF